MGYITGIAVMGVLLATVTIILIVFCCIYRRRSTKSKDLPQRDLPQRDSEMSVNPTYQSTGTASRSKSMSPAPKSNGEYAEPGYHVLHHPNGQANGTPYANSSQTLGYDQLDKKAETSIPNAYNYPAPCATDSAASRRGSIRCTERAALDDAYIHIGMWTMKLFSS